MPIDYSKYPKNWKTEIVPKIIRRAGNKCESCFVENGEGLYSVALNIRSCGKYSSRRIWVSSAHDAIRLVRIGGGSSDKKIIKVVLTVAHLDHDEENHDVSLDRLQAMCQWCHTNYDAKEKYRRACTSGS